MSGSVVVVCIMENDAVYLLNAEIFLNSRALPMKEDKNMFHYIRGPYFNFSQPS